MSKECPSCGKIIEEGQLFCPACGTKIAVAPATKKRPVNTAFESELINIDGIAEVCLSKKLGAGIGGSIAYEKLNKCEEYYLDLIRRYPTEPKAYLGYVNFMVDRAIKLSQITNIFARTQYFIGDIKLQVSRCRNYLTKAKEYADESDLEKILQMESLVSSKLEALANDSSIAQNQEKNKKAVKISIAFTVILFVILIIIWLAQS